MMIIAPELRVESTCKDDSRDGSSISGDSARRSGLHNKRLETEFRLLPVSPSPSGPDVLGGGCSNDSTPSTHISSRSCTRST